MNLTIDNAWIEKPLSELFQRHELATADSNRGLMLGRVQADGTYPVLLQGNLSAYQIAGVPSSRTLFLAGSDGMRVQVKNFVVSDFPFLRSRWRKEVRERGGSPVSTIEDLDRFLGLISAHIAKQAAELNLPAGAQSTVALLNLHVARGTNWLSYTNVPTPKLPDELICWLQAGVSIEYILHFFNAAAGGGFNRKTGRPMATLAEIEEMQGIPVSKLRLLYSND